MCWPLCPTEAEEPPLRPLSEPIRSPEALAERLPPLATLRLDATARCWLRVMIDEAPLLAVWEANPRWLARLAATIALLPLARRAGSILETVLVLWFVT